VRCEVTLTPEAHAALVRDVAAAVLRVQNARVHDHRIGYWIPEFCKHTGTSDRTAKRLISNGELPVVRPGGGHRLMVLSEHLQLWLYGQQRASDMPVMGPDPQQKKRMSVVRAHKKKG
jgi:excisionase family DNA binding protein